MARPAQGDHTTGLAFVASILAALRQAENTKTGQIVETSLYEAAVWTQASDYAVTAVDKAPVRKRDREHMLAISANRFPGGDGKWIVFNMMPDAAYWPKICAALNLEDLIEDKRFVDSSARYKLMPELIALFDEALSLKTRDEWGRIFDQAGLIWGPVLSLDEVPKDPQALQLGMFPEIKHSSIGSYPTVNIPMRFATSDVRPRGPAPRLGQHTDSILESLGFNEAQLDSLKKNEIILSS